MKKIILSFVVMLLITLWACEQESNIEEQNSIENVKEVKIVGEIDNKLFTPYRNCIVIPKGRLVGGRCQDRLSFQCGREEICFPQSIDPCKFIPCNIEILDPWVLYDKLIKTPEVFGSLREYIDFPIKNKSQFFPFGINKGILGLQYYAENHLMNINYGDPMPQPNIFYLEENLTLDCSFAKELGLEGNIIKSGKYPLIFNEKNNTYNVILKVK
ncbi:hypothetical protein ATE84_0968 [Aquimarina sp. MAR_2010_214]|uniref:hypothetical protein n=1 Tax=Aquimarina sp. MAR_2010_214 TaxID=1250026 RepID=UPI000C701E8C|nr:hypothetical protein [Aquimarina sp. MAR_2010_214]PKV48952.1 hypothetical protein ATE84_0968 [Aquimarina sp. MAR_2010_214]